jgi:hypothetical protein
VYFRVSRVFTWSRPKGHTRPSTEGRSAMGVLWPLAGSPRLPAHRPYLVGIELDGGRYRLGDRPYPLRSLERLLFAMKCDGARPKAEVRGFGKWRPTLSLRRCPAAKPATAEATRRRRYDNVRYGWPLHRRETTLPMANLAISRVYWISANDLRSTAASVVPTSQNFARGNRHCDAEPPLGAHREPRFPPELAPKPQRLS